MDLNKIFDEINKNAIKLEFQTHNKEDIPIGASKFGGNPDVPKDFKWFYYTGEDFNGVKDTRPLSFLAQINCKEISQYDEEGLLPSKGILYFFYELATMHWGYDPAHKGSAKVYYFDGDVSELIRTNGPDRMPDDFKFPEIKLGFSKKYDLPAFQEFIEQYDYHNWDQYDEFKIMNGFENEEPISKLLGYANVIQNGMQLECEKVTNGIRGLIHEIEPKKLKKLKENSDQWQLLFQMDTVTTNDFELMFGDCGRIYYYIKKEDLKNGNFDDCWLIMQCG